MEELTRHDGDRIVASAAQYLIEGGEMEAAEALLLCNVEHLFAHGEVNMQTTSYGVEIGLRGPRLAVEKIENGYNDVSRQISTAVENALPFGVWLQRLSSKASVFVPDQNWRNDLLEIIKGKGISNQASGAQNTRMWQGFRFRSATEIKIAEALDRAGVLFFPLPKARVVTPSGHMNVEPDFVICQEGRWGILEVDGEPFHPPERSAIEHDRDRLFKAHGVICVERFDAKRCYSNPDQTVQNFLLLMVKAYRRP